MAARMDPIRLGAFLDGELSPEEAAEVVMHLARSPRDQSLADALARQQELLARAFAPVLEAPVPDRLRRTILPASPDVRAAAGAPAPAGAGWRPARSALRRFAPAVAAALAAAVVAFVVLPRDPGGDGIAAGVIEQAALGHGLDTLLSGERMALDSGDTLALVASFVDAEGTLCREFTVFHGAAPRFEHAVACRVASGWDVEIVVTEQATAVADAGYAPASGPGTRAIGALLDEIGAGIAMAVDEEEAARARGWR
jgi:hypothetical protein